MVCEMNFIEESRHSGIDVASTMGSVRLLARHVKLLSYSSVTCKHLRAFWIASRSPSPAVGSSLPFLLFTVYLYSPFFPWRQRPIESLASCSCVSGQHKRVRIALHFFFCAFLADTLLCVLLHVPCVFFIASTRVFLVLVVSLKSSFSQPSGSRLRVPATG